MENQEAIEIAAGIEEVINSAVVTAIQSEHNIPVVDLDDGGNDNSDVTKVTLKCVVENCDFITSKCVLEEVSCQPLMLHTDIEHKKQQKSEKFKSSNKIWVPESLDLNPSEDNGEEYLFWLARFNSYLSECCIVKTDEKYSKLKSRLSFKIFQHISDAQDYESLIAALENLYVKKRNIYATRNRLVSCKQMSGENVRAYLLRLNQLAKLCQFIGLKP